MKCPSVTTINAVKKVKECLISEDEDAKKLAEEGNKLKPLECVTKIKAEGCKIVKNKNQHEDKYKECFDLLNSIEGPLQKCDPIDPNDKN